MNPTSRNCNSVCGPCIMTSHSIVYISDCSYSVCHDHFRYLQSCRMLGILPLELHIQPRTHRQPRNMRSVQIEDNTEEIINFHSYLFIPYYLQDSWCLVYLYSVLVVYLHWAVQFHRTREWG